MNLRDATPDDARMLARLHVQAWDETYRDIFPPEQHAARGLVYRFRLWTRILAQPDARVALAPDLGFAQVGPQRDAGLREAGYPWEVYCLYVLAAGHGTGLGRALMTHALGPDPHPFSVIALQSSPRACAFYEKVGGRLAFTRPDKVGDTPVIDCAYVWDAPVRVHD